MRDIASEKERETERVRVRTSERQKERGGTENEVAAISSTVVSADARTLATAACSMSFKLKHGPASCPPLSEGGLSAGPCVCVVIVPGVSVV